MNRFKTLTKSTLLLAVLAIGTLLMVGCSGNPVGEITSEPTLLQRFVSADGPEYARRIKEVTQYAEVIISSKKGGNLSVEGVDLFIPRRAVANDTLYSIDLPDLNVFYAEFGTDGLKFDNPVTVTFSYADADMAGVDESSISLAWYNEKFNRWHKIDCEVDIVNKTVTGQLYHFSAYGLISD